MIFLDVGIVARLGPGLEGGLEPPLLQQREREQARLLRDEAAQARQAADGAARKRSGTGACDALR